MAAPAAPSRSSRGARALLLGAPLLVAASALAGDAPTGGVRDLLADARPALESRCVACHDPTTKAGGLDLTALLAPDARTKAGAPVPDRVEAWRKVRARVAAKEMPPKDAPALAADARDRLLVAVDRAIEAASPPPIPGDPGRVTLRRLNRTEWRRTVRDLLAVDDRSSDGFPSDDVGSGFDTLGDVLSVSPLLVEKLEAAAERVAQAAVLDPSGPDAPARRLEAEAMAMPHEGVRREPGGANFFSGGAIVGEVRLPRDGEYEIRVRAFGDLAGDEPPRLAWRIGEKDLPSVSVTAPRSRPEILRATLRARAGVHAISVAFVNDFYDPKNPDPRGRDRNLHVDWVEVAGPLGVLDDPPESHRRVLAPDPGGSDVRGRARAVLTPLATRAWRRPPSAGDLEPLVGLVVAETGAGASFEQGVRTALAALLVSPRFLFHVEVLPAPEDPRAIVPLDDFALASRLSYFLWSSLPDDALFARAQAGTLRRDLAAEVRRMLADPKADALVEGFAEQWLTLRRLASVEPDRERFPTFDERLRDDMLRETQMYFEAVVTEDRDVLDLVDGRFTFVNERLAAHYGISGVSGERFRRVATDGERRAGIFTQASVLTVTSYPTRTSPVRRGKWVLEQVLGQTVPPPPPGAGDLNEGREAAAAATLRQRTERHRADPACASCHVRLDPLGFGLEPYDAIGRWRTKEGALPIDGTGTLPDGRSFRTPAELRAIWRQDPGFRRGFAERLLVYAIGRALSSADAPFVDRIVADAEASGRRFSAFVLGVVESPAFGSARGEEASR